MSLRKFVLLVSTYFPASGIPGICHSGAPDCAKFASALKHSDESKAAGADASFLSLLQNKHSFKDSTDASGIADGHRYEALESAGETQAVSEWFKQLQELLQESPPLPPSPPPPPPPSPPPPHNNHHHHKMTRARQVPASGQFGFPELREEFIIKADHYADREFTAKIVNGSRIDFEMGYVRPGGHAPDELCGLFWLDQGWRSSIAQDLADGNATTFRDAAALIQSPEVALSFIDGPASWDPDTRCLGPMPTYAGDQGHYAFLDTQIGQDFLQFESAVRVTFDHCYVGSVQRGDSIIESIPAMRIPGTKTWLDAPRWLFVFYSEKAPWGWKRVTSVGPDVAKWLSPERLEMLSKVFPPQWIALLTVGSSGAPIHYPMIQIVNGSGAHTKYWKEWAAFIGEQKVRIGVVH